jgi:hypothetical protein
VDAGIAPAAVAMSSAKEDVRRYEDAIEKNPHQVSFIRRIEGFLPSRHFVPFFFARLAQ